MPHQLHDGAHSLELVSGLFDARPGNVRIGIAGAEKSRHSVQGAFMMQIRAGRADQASRECDQRAVSRRMPGNELCGEAGSLGEAADHYLALRHACDGAVLDDRLNLSDCRGEPRLILLDGRKKRVWVPGVICGLRSQIGDSLVVHIIRQRKDVLCRASSPVQKNDGKLRLRKQATGSEDRSVTVWVNHSPVPV